MKRMGAVGSVLTAATIAGQSVAAQLPGDTIQLGDSLTVQATALSEVIPEYNPLKLRLGRDVGLAQITEGNPTILQANPHMGVLLYNHLVAESQEVTLAGHPFVISPDMDYHFNSMYAGRNLSRRPIRATALNKGSDLVVQHNANVQPGIEASTDMLTATSVGGGIVTEGGSLGMEAIVHHPGRLERKVQVLDAFMNGIVAGLVATQGDALAVQAGIADLDLYNEAYIETPIWGDTNQAYISGRARHNIGNSRLGLSATLQRGSISTGDHMPVAWEEQEGTFSAIQWHEGLSQHSVKRMDVTASLETPMIYFDLTARNMTWRQMYNRSYTSEHDPTQPAGFRTTGLPAQTHQQSQQMLSARTKKSFASAHSILQIGAVLDITESSAYPSVDILVARQHNNVRASLEAVMVHDKLSDALRDRHLLQENTPEDHSRNIFYAQGKIRYDMERSNLELTARRMHTDVDVMRGVMIGNTLSGAYSASRGNMEFSIAGVLRDLHLERADTVLQAPLTPAAEMRASVRLITDSAIFEITYAGSSDIWFPNTTSRLTNLNERHIASLSFAKQFGPAIVDATFVNPLDLIDGIDNYIAGYTPNNPTEKNPAQYTPYPVLPLLKFQIAITP